ncbi:MAG: YlbF family regulator [Suilimivivens sp.]
MEQSLENATMGYVKAIKETKVYRKYCEQLERLKEYPEQYKKVNEFRKKNYEIQNTTQKDELFDKMDAFEQEYEKFREDPVVDDFLRAELAFCRMMQEINLMITEAVDFE